LEKCEQLDWVNSSSTLAYHLGGGFGPLSGHKIE